VRTKGAVVLDLWVAEQIARVKAETGSELNQRPRVDHTTCEAMLSVWECSMAGTVHYPF